MSEHQTWQRETAVRRIRNEQDGPNPPPLRISIASAATYVDASVAQVEAWWRGRGA